MERRIGVALVGGGFALHTQLPAFRLLADAEVRALVGRDAARTQEQARRHGIARASARLEDVLEDASIDLVCISTPPDLHRPMAEAALAAGKQVLCEKPMALDAAEAESMCRTARSAQRLAVLDHELRFDPNLIKLRHLLREGYLGRPLHVQASILDGGRLDPQRPFDWWSEARRGGGALGAFGSHVLDWLRWTFGELQAANGMLHTFVRQRPLPGELRPRAVDADDHAAFGVRFAGAQPASAGVLLSVAAHRGGGLRFEVFGSEGLLRYDREGRLWGSRRDPAAGSEHEQPPLEDLSEPERLSPAALKQLPDSIWARAFAGLARGLVAAVREGLTELPGAAGFGDGWAVQRALDAVRRAAVSGAWEPCDPQPAPRGSDSTR